MKKFSSLWLVPALIAAGATGYLTAGPLTPPPGPVASTHKTLTEIEPRIAINSVNTPGDAECMFRITQPGSYYLTGNVAFAQASKAVILIASSNVVVDLNGFAINGQAFPTGSATNAIALASTGSVSNVTVRNGTVRNCSQSGVLLTWGQVGGTGFLVEQVHATDNGSVGIYITRGGVVRACNATNNSGAGISVATGVVDSCSSQYNGTGISAGQGSTIVDSIAWWNSGTGISANQSVVSRCAAINNSGYGISGSNSTIADCTTSSGLSVNGHSIVRGNICNNSTGAALLVAGSDNRVEGNNCFSSSIGVQVTGTGNIVVRNTCSGNATNWNIVAGNSFLIVKSPVTASNFTGDAGGGGYGSTDPNANFTY